jgi:FAD/FMN-containing dehydrogenase
MKSVNADTLARLAAIVGEATAITDPAAMVHYMREWRDKWVGTSPLVLRPESTQQVSDILKIAHETNTKIVPQSGNTGLVGGGIPNGEVLLSLDRMTKIIAVDALDNSITVQAGCTLKSVQDAADAMERLFPLSLASEGSCRMGGNLATNAGGVNVLAYGNARDLCLGLEVVLADGRVWNGLRSLRKDNTGYDLKNLFIGSEGTLGIITAAVLKLFPKPSRHDTALVAVPSPHAALDLLALLKAVAGSRLTAFEIIPRIGIEFTTRHMNAQEPFAQAYPWYVLAEVINNPEEELATVINNAFVKGLALDAIVAQSEAQRQAFWALRENMSESQKFEGGSIKHDVSVPVSKVAVFLDQAITAIEKFMPGARPVPFGHLGDGNIHFNVSQPVGMDKAAYLSRWSDMNDLVHGIVLKLGGSISAEHGIGVLKRDEMARIKSPVEMDLMRTMKQALDPKGILNPGKVLA